MLRTLLRVKLASLKSSASNQFSKKGKPSKGKIVMYAILIIYFVVVLVGMMGTMFGTLGELLLKNGMTDLYFIFVGIASMGLGFITCIFTAKSFLYEAKDNELLMSMPIKPRTILLSRIIMLMILEVTYTLIIMVPAVVVYCIFAQVSVWGLFIAIVGSVLLGLLTVSLACLVAWVIAVISARLRYKNIISVVIMGAAFAGYFYVCFNLSSVFQGLLESGEEIGIALSRAFPPLFYFGRAVMGDMMATLLLVIWTVVPFAITYFILSKAFLRITTANRGEKKIKYVKKELKTSSAVFALVKKELRRFVSLPMYMMNSGLGILFHIIIAVVLVVNKDMFFQIFEIDASIGEFLPYIFLGVLAFLTSMNQMTAPSLSLEGRSLWIVKSLPLTSWQVFKGKLIAGTVVFLPTLIILEIVVVVMLPMSIFQMGMMFILPVLMQIFVSMWGLVANIMMPRFDWVNETAVIKQSGSVMVSMFGAMAVVALPLVLYAIILSKVLSIEVFVVLCLVYILALIGGCYWYIRHVGEKKFVQM